MIFSCIIIEDEPLAAEKLENFISKVPNLQLKGCFDNAVDGINFLNQHSVDILFLDIQMEHLTGIQMLESFEIKPYVIITSAYAEYALKGYELHVFDYLLKPFGFDRFLVAVNSVIKDINEKVNTNITKTHLFIKTEYRLENICINDILYIEGMKEYLRIVTSDKKIMSKLSFKKILSELSCNNFIQVHKSWVVHIPKISSIENNRIYIGDKIIPIGKVYKDAFNKVLG